MMHPQDDNGGKGSGSELEFGPDTARLDALLGELKEADPPPPAGGCGAPVGIGAPQPGCGGWV